MIKGQETVLRARVRPSERDNDYNLPDDSEEDTVALQGCLVSWGSVGENLTIEYNQSTETAVIQMPINTDIKSTDVIILRGERYQVDGEPVRWIVPAGFRVQPKLWVQVKKESR